MCSMAVSVCKEEFAMHRKLGLALAITVLFSAASSLAVAQEIPDRAYFRVLKQAVQKSSLLTLCFGIKLQ